jgi:ribosomal-protein-alanine N-acetyltransferase
MNRKAEVRIMKFDDLERVMEIENESFSDPWSRKSYEFEVAGNRFSIPIVLEVNNEIIGHAVVWKIFEELHIATIAIVPEYRGQGWGEFLLSSLMEMAAGAEFALLEVRPSNTGAIRLYEKFGFEKVGMRRHYYRNGEDALIMRKEFKKNL